MLVATLAISIVLFWILALAPPLVTRFLLAKRPLGKVFSWSFVVAFWFVNYMAQYMVGEWRQQVEGGPPPHPGMIGLLLMAWASYAILRYGSKVKGGAVTFQNVNTDANGQWTDKNDALVEAIKLSNHRPGEALAKVEKILADGVHINARNEQGFTALRVAQYHECPTAITSLLETAGAKA